MKKEEFKIINSRLDLKRIKLEDVDVNYSSIIKNICYIAVLNHIFSKSIPLIQMYYLAYSKQDDEKIQNASDNFEYRISIKIFIYCLGFIGIKFLFLLTDIINESTITLYFELFKNKKYYEIGELFRNCCIVLNLLNILFYFLFMFITNLYLNYILTQKIENEENISQIEMNILSNKIIRCINVNFLALIFYSINKPLQNMLLCFEDKKKVLFSNFLKFILLVTLSKYFSKRDPEFYFLLGIGTVNVISELFCFIYLVSIQSLSNPYPQAWIRINFSVIKESRMICFVKELLKRSKEFLILFLLNYLREFLLLISILISTYYNQNPISVHVMQQYSLTFFSFFCIGIFFDSNRITNINIIRFFGKYTDEINKKNESYLKYKKLLTSSKDDDDDNNNLKIITQIKIILLSGFVINFLFLSIYFIFCFVDPFGLISLIRIRIDYSIILFTAFFGSIFSISKEFFTLNKLLENKLFLTHFWIGYLFIFLNFFLISFFNLMNPNLLIISSNFGNIYLLLLYYKYLNNFDIRVVTLEKILNCNDINTIHK